MPDPTTTTDWTSRVQVIPASAAPAAQHKARMEFEAACHRAETLVGEEVLDRWYPATAATR